MALCVNAAAAAVTGLPPLQVGASKRPGSCNGAHGSSQISSFAVCNTGVLHLTATRTPLLRHSNNLRKIVCMQDLAEQIKEMKAAEKRWESQVKEGKVKSLSAKEAGYAIQLPNYTFLDVRPSSERRKAYVKDSIWIPMYEVDKSLDPGTLFKKLSNFTMGGWWSGLPLMKYNERFMPDVVAKIPKSYNLVVGCQKGLRSLAACEQLYKAGYRNLFWLNGGFDAAQEGDLEREGSQPLNFAGIGGVSEFLGWTDVQRAEAAKQGFGYRAVLFARLVGLLLAVDLFFLGAQQLTHYFQELRH
ncbi:unnamed protein product [Sphagnum jensenii]|uniref:Rhodanese domain-containing protein n=1 Tax=Sphagnum jensenii TaxID=128206 RepID=A0ABP1BKH0_9BRYO